MSVMLAQYWHATLDQCRLPMSTQNWHATLGRCRLSMLAQNWHATLGRCRLPMSAQYWHATLGRSYHLDIIPTSARCYSQYWADSRELVVDVGPTLTQLLNRTWDGINAKCMKCTESR